MKVTTSGGVVSGHLTSEADSVLTCSACPKLKGKLSISKADGELPVISMSAGIAFAGIALSGSATLGGDESVADFHLEGDASGLFGEIAKAIVEAVSYFVLPQGRSNGQGEVLFRELNEKRGSRSTPGTRSSPSVLAVVRTLPGRATSATVA